MASLLRTLLPALFVALLGVGGPLTPAAAQGPLRSSRNPDDPTMTAEIGFGGGLWPNRWTPLNISITGGAKAFSGELTISYPQDDRVGAQIVRTAAATPGKTTTIGILVSLPMHCSEVSVALHRTRVGRPVARVVLTSSGFPDDNELPLPSLSAASPIVVALGEREDPVLASARAIADADGTRGAVGVADPDVAFFSPTRLPPTWAALESALLVVTTNDAVRGCDPRTLAAVREWVSSGGRLVILASTPGEGWKSWLGATPEQPLPVVVGPARAIPVSSDLATPLGLRPPEADPHPEQSYNLSNTPNTPAERRAEPDGNLEHAATIAARPVSLTPSGVERGWSLRYAFDGEASGTGEAGAAFAAEGPFGFGWVVVAGFNPERVAAMVTDEATRRVWFDLLGVSLADWRGREPSQMARGWGNAGDWFSIGGFTVSDTDTRFARGMALDQISNVPALSNAAFPVLALGIFVLAMLIGPVDAVVLRRARLRHRSWATALGWITLASLAAYFIPGAIRSGDTIVNRFTVLDVSQTDAPDAGPLPAWRAGHTGVFAGASFTQQFQGELGGAWWRPASGRDDQYWGGGHSGSSRRSFVTRQSLPDFSSLAPGDDAWGGLIPGHSGAGGNLPTPAPLKLWTFHTYQDHARAATSLRAEVRVDHSADPPVWTVDLLGVPEGATIDAAALRVPSERWHELTFEQTSGRLVATTEFGGTPEPPAAWRLPSNSPAMNWQAPPTGSRYAQAFLLPGPDRRGWGITQAVARGDAVVYLSLRGVPMDITLDTPGVHSHMQLCRLVVPVIRSGDAPPSEPAQETSK